ncbi:ribonuclease HII [Acetonema longum]|uniref:Ribonuclease HII n=1 Tax=Acetonema longum DSM 6540 TaxID=1009370 RepID=F7NL20_9FIRM|nr:ribonuclease HII [Acetonema longum]EGO63125.1 ribonuclease HII [Acetonema longum DSM 6540]
MKQKWIETENQNEYNRVMALYNPEKQFSERGYQYIAGIDEAGRGPLAGPLVVAGVILPLEAFLPQLNDSKKLTVNQREKLYDEIYNTAVAVTYAIISVEEIDRMNILQATLQGMSQVAAALEPKVQAVMIDGPRGPQLPVPTQCIVGGDGLSASIAAASIVAKVVRDRLMIQLDQEFPAYGFAQHKGYGTKQHMSAIEHFGACPIHRRSFEPIKSKFSKEGAL